MMKSATRGTVILLATAAFAAGCTAAPQREAAHAPGGTWARPRPPLTLAEQRVHCGSQRQQAHARLPAGFVAEIAVLCAPAMKPAHNNGQVVFIERVADHGLAALVAALRRPSARPAPGIICPVQLVIVPPLFLVSADGQVIRPVIPADACGSPQQQVLTALQQVPWTTVPPAAHP